ncbi:MAG: hypothetical protein R2874_13530 [Desulfobacterales bacterium]
MSIKDNLIEKLESQIDAWDKEVDALKAKAEKKAEPETEKAGAALKEGIMDNVRSLQANINSAKKKIDDIREAGEDRIDEFKSQVNEWLK